MLRFFTAGESHGPSLLVIIEGLPAGLPITIEEIDNELARRRLGYGRGPRMRFETDDVTIHAGIRHGRTLGTPVGIEVHNSEWPKWVEEMSAAPGMPTKILTQPRPGHVDLAGMLKYGFSDARDVLERASARETAARVVAGTFAKALISHLGVSVISHTIQMGEARVPDGIRPGPGDLETIDASEVRCFDQASAAAMVREIKAAAKVGDSLGGIAEVLAFDVPLGLGSHVQWDRKLDGLISQAVMSIPAIKGVEIGDGFALASLRGSVAHDAIYYDPETASYYRTTSHAGGMEAGISNGALMVVRAAMKPLSTLNRPVIHTVDMATKEDAISFKERTDTTAVPAMGVVAETMVALVLASEALRKFGGDSLAEFVRNYEHFVQAMNETPSAVPVRLVDEPVTNE